MKAVLVLLAIALVGAPALALQPPPAAAQTAPTAPTTPTAPPTPTTPAPTTSNLPIHIDSWAWCGVRPTDPAAPAAVAALAKSGIDATFGPCIAPPSGYTPANTKNRYADPDTYFTLVQLNASVGMKTVVYDARLWSDDAGIRNAAIQFWLPVTKDIVAWDLGDEFDPDSSEWPILVHRWNNVLNDATARTGVRPFANQLPWALDKALTDLPGVGWSLSFDQYGGDRGEAVARKYSPKVQTLMCAVNVLDHSGLTPTDNGIRTTMQTLIKAGCGRFLVFGGFPVYDTTLFGAQSLTDRSGNPTSWGRATLQGALTASYAPQQPARLLETRTGPNLGTIDNQFNGIGTRQGQTVTELPVAGRAGVPKDADSVVLNVTVVDAQAPGFLTVFPCGTPQPNAANLNYVKGSTLSNAVVAKIGTKGSVCFFAMASLDLVVDVNGYYPAGTSFVSVQPARVLETRTGPGLATVDNLFNGIGARPEGGIVQLPVQGRAGVPTDASSVVLNITAVDPQNPGFVTVWPCGSPQPNAANLNYAKGQTVANAVVAKVGDNGQVCLFTLAASDLVVDVNGYFPADAPFTSLQPARLLETRTGPGLGTVDNLNNGEGQRGAGVTTILRVAGRATVPADADAVVLNVTAVNATLPGFITVFPCGTPMPNAANLNYGRGTTLANAVVAQVGAGGTVCLFTLSPVDLVVDVDGYFPAKLNAHPPSLAAV